MSPSASAASKAQLLAEAVVGNKLLQPAFAKAVTLTLQQIDEVAITVEAAPNFGATFMADVQVCAMLFNNAGVGVGKNLTKAPEAIAWFRSTFYDELTTAGTWRLKLENSSDREIEVILTTWKGAGK